MEFQLVSRRCFDDYSSIAQLHNLMAIDPVSAEDLYTSETETVSHGSPRRVLALDASDTILGTSLARPIATLPGTFLAMVSVDPQHRQQGIGSRLYHDLELFVRSAGATELLTSVPDNDPTAFSFAEGRGFTLHQHWVYFALDLQQVDISGFAHLKAKMHEQGIRFLTLAEAGNTLESQRKLYELNRRTSLDAPGEDSFPSFEEFVQDICSAPWFHADGQIIAAAGEQWVGLGAVGLDGAIAHNAFTGVDKAYRRRHIAEALTVQTIEYALRYGATQLQVFNDSRNVAMLNMQEKFGYKPIPGRYIMTKPLLTG